MEIKHRNPDESVVYVKVGKNSTIGDNCTFGYHCSIGNNCTIEDNCTIGNYCTVGDDCTIGNGCMLGNGCTISNNCTVYFSHCITGRRTFYWTCWFEHGIPQFCYGCEQYPLDEWTAVKCAELSSKHGTLHDYDRDMTLAMVRAWVAWHTRRVSKTLQLQKQNTDPEDRIRALYKDWKNKRDFTWADEDADPAIRHTANVLKLLK